MSRKNKGIRISGKKLGKHTHIEGILKKSIRDLLDQDGVERIILGPLYGCKHKYPTGALKYQRDIDAGIKVNGCHGMGVQDLFVYIKPITKREDIKKYLNMIYHL